MASPTMCGIAALVTPQHRPPPGVVAGMVAALQHRGPDSQAVHHFGRCTLGSARLSVVDIEGGRQPILSPDGQSGITFNGAIYGYRAIRQQLAGYPFKTDTDTEVILALQDRWGDEFLAHLPGMFAFALWDERRQTLTCARDRFGEKPLFYAFGPDGELVVASEIKAILASGLVQPVLSRRAVSQYLTRLHVHPAHTIYANVHALPPAHVLRWRRGKVRVERYWQPPQAVLDITMDAAVERFRALFDQAVRRQLVADVPVGVLLSGGIDSTTVAAVASQMQPGLQTFSFGFMAGVESELPYARASAGLYGTTHHEHLDQGIDLPSLLQRMQLVYDEPFGDSSNIPTFLLCEQARRHVTVALGGDGADELLGGYLVWSREYLQNGAPQAMATAPAVAGARRWMQRLARRWGRAGPPQSGSALVHRYADGFRVCFTPQVQRQMGLTPADDDSRDCARYQRDTLGDMLRFDTEHYLPGDILVKTDRAAMAHGLELRAPFLDLDLASFCMALPDALKVDDRQEKLLLRRAFESQWTAAVRGRAKQGFGSPMAHWLSAPAARALKCDVLGDRHQRLYDLLDFDAVQPFVAPDNQQTWSLLVLALWLAEHPCALPAN
jgi:asparagine synthase (glutamine-hydrolysing)